MEGLGGLLVKVGIDHSGVAEGKAKVEGLLSSMGSSGVPGIQKIGGMLQGMSPLALGAAGAVAGIGVAAVAIGKESIEAFTRVGGEVLKLQRVAGGSAESMSAVRAMAEQSGVGVDKLSKGLLALSGHLSKNDTAAKGLGFAFRDAHGQVMPMDQLLLKLSDKFHNMPNGVDKTALASSLFGRKVAIDLLPMLNKGHAQLLEFADGAKKAGLILSESNLEAVKESTKAHRKFTETIEGAKVQIGAGLLPVVTKLTQEGIQAMTPALHLLVAAFKIVGPAIELMMLPFKALGKVMEVVGPPIEKFADFVGKKFDSVKKHFESLTGKQKEHVDKAKGLGEQETAASQEQLAEQETIAKEREKTLDEIGKYAGASAKAQADASGKTIEALKEEAEEAKRQAGERKKGLQEIADAAGASARDQVASSKLTGDQISILGADVKKTSDAIKSSFESAGSVVSKFGSQTTVSGAEILKFFQDTKNNAEAWGKDIKTLMASGVNQGIIDEIASAGPKAEPLVKGMLDLVKTGGVNAVNELNTQTGRIESETSTSLANMQVIARTGGVGIGKAATEGVHDGATILNAWSKSIGGIFKDMGDDAVGKMNSTEGDAKGAGIGFGSSAAEGAQSGLSGLPGHFTAAGQAGISATHEQRGEARGAAYGIGAEMGSGMQAGLGGTVQGIRNIMRWYVQEAIAAGKAAAGIASPSKLFRDQMGKPIGLGVAEGIKDSKGYVEDALAMLTQAQGGSLVRGMRSGVLPTSSPISPPAKSPSALTIGELHMHVDDKAQQTPAFIREAGWLASGLARGRL